MPCIAIYVGKNVETNQMPLLNLFYQHGNPGRIRTFAWIISDPDRVYPRRRNYYCGLVGSVCPNVCGYCPPSSSLATSY